MADTYDIANQANQIAQTAMGLYANYANLKQGDEALEESSRQFDENMKWLQDQNYDAMQFAREQHAAQMDFANRQLNDNVSIANRNLEMQQNAFDYQKHLNSTQMEREDSAMQRLIADYKKAGFSPLAAIGSSGASSTALSSGQAPQLDASGINQASGQYADFARQYSQLALAAKQDYMKNRSQLAEKHNSDITAAKFTLRQMKNDMIYKNMSYANEMFNSQVNYRNAKMQNQYLEEQFKYLQDKHNWEEKNGYRPENVQSALIAAIKEYLNSKSDAGTTIEKAFDLSSQMVSKAEEIISDGSKKVEKTVLEKIYNSDLKNWQKTALTFYVTSIKLGLQENRYVKGMRAMFNAGKSLYYKVFDDD